MKRSSIKEYGFSAVVILLFLILIAIIGFTGYYVWHSQQQTNKTLTSATNDSQSTPVTSSKSKTSSQLNLNDAVTQAQTVYDAFVTDLGTAGGTASTSSKTWDYSFINNHKTWFSQAFLTKASTTNNPSNEPDYLLICTSGSAMLGSVKVNGTSLSGQIAQAVAVESIGGEGGTSTQSTPISLKNIGGLWVIDSVDLSSCP